MPTKKAVTFHPLDDADLMAAAGRMLIRHSNLDYQLKMTIRRLAGVTPDEARRAYAYTGSKELRKLVVAHATREFGLKSPALIKVQSLMAECAIATEQRNGYVHDIWAAEFTEAGKGCLFGADGALRPLPSMKSLDKLDAEIKRLVEALQNANQSFIAQAMKKH